MSLTYDQAKKIVDDYSYLIGQEFGEEKNVFRVDDIVVAPVNIELFGKFTMVYDFKRRNLDQAIKPFLGQQLDIFIIQVHSDDESKLGQYPFFQFIKDFNIEYESSP